jgi:hypothetical protein
VRLDRTLGPQVVSWVEANLVHGPGDVQGQRLELDDERVRFLLGCYEIDEPGRRVVRRAVFMRPKGRAKTELAAAVAFAEALGPVRFAGSIAWFEMRTLLGSWHRIGLVVINLLSVARFHVRLHRGHTYTLRIYLPSRQAPTRPLHRKARRTGGPVNGPSVGCPAVAGPPPRAKARVSRRGSVAPRRGAARQPRPRRRTGSRPSTACPSRSRTRGGDA